MAAASRLLLALSLTFPGLTIGLQRDGSRTPTWEQQMRLGAAAHKPGAAGSKTADSRAANLAALQSQESLQLQLP